MATAKQLLIRMDNPEWATPEGRVRDEVLRTFAAIADGQTPETVLGGLMINRGYELPGVRPKTVGQVSASAHIMPNGVINHRGDTLRDVLDDLITVGLVEVTNRKGSGEAFFYELETDRPAIERFQLVGVDNPTVSV